MHRLEVGCAVRPLYGSLSVKGLREDGENVFGRTAVLTFWRRNYFVLILAHPVYKI